MNKLFIGLMAALAFSPIPVSATSFSDSKDLIEIVEKTGTEVVFRDNCDDNIQGKYVYYENVDRLTICKNNIDIKDPDELWEVVTHESIHVAQACAGETIFKETYLPRIDRTLKTDTPHYWRILQQYPDDHRVMEAEAFYSETLAPDDVKYIVSKACDVD